MESTSFSPLLESGRKVLPKEIENTSENIGVRIFLSLNIASDCILPGKAKHSSLEFVAAIVTVCVVIVTLLLVGS